MDFFLDAYIYSSALLIAGFIEIKNFHRITFLYQHISQLDYLDIRQNTRKSQLSTTSSELFEKRRPQISIKPFQWLKPVLKSTKKRQNRNLGEIICIHRKNVSSRKNYLPSVHRLKKHKSQIQTATNIWNILENSEIVLSHKNCDRMQDPYSIRCIPQVHGACREMVKNASIIINNEINIKKAPKL